MPAFAFVFPGQGSQSVGMLDAWNGHPAVQTALQEASEALGQDLAELIHQGPKEELGLTTNTQPVMLVAAIAAYRVWLAEVVGAGAMAAVLGLEAAKVVEICAQAQAGFAAGSGEVVQAANFNDPGQTVISGSKAAVDKACELLKAAGAKRTLPLPVSAPFHCALMKPAAEKLRLHLNSISLQAPQIPVINNIDVAQENDPARICDALYRQAFGPVRWVESMQRMQQLGVSHVVECGPGKVLTGMVKRICPELQSQALYDPATLAETRAFLTA